MNDDRYEVIELIVKAGDGFSWFDRISDLITANCQGSETDPCTCGLESMGGMVGTLDQCYRYILGDDYVEEEWVDSSGITTVDAETYDWLAGD